jgi:hypothetical protein
VYRTLVENFVWAHTYWRLPESSGETKPAHPLQQSSLENPIGGRKMRTNRCLLLGLILIASQLSIPAHGEPQDGTEKYRFAFVYLNDEPAATKFQQLLAENNQATDLIPLDAVTTTDWAKYSAVIVGSDIEQAWSAPQAKAIADAKVPVLGLGEGGYYFFGKLHLGIGSPNGYHGGEVGAKAAQPNKTDYWTAAKLNQPASGELMLYSSTSHVAIFLSDVSPGEVTLAYELSNKSYAPIIEQDRRYVLWGFTASPEKMTPLGKRVFVHTCQYVARAGHPGNATPEKKLASALKSKFAFIYLKNDESTASFQQLLTSSGLSVELVGLEDVPKTDFTPYAAVIVGPDIERAWSVAGANKIAASKKPVLGLGEGGSALFEKLHLDIGWMHTYHGGEVGVRAADAAKLPYWTSTNLNPADSDEQMLYSSTGHVAVFLSKVSPGVVPLGYELNNKKYAPIIEQDQRYVLWGFRESPLKMTPLGKQLFIHTCRYVATEPGPKGLSTSSVNPSVVNSASQDDSVAQLSQRVRLLEARVIQLEQSRQPARAAKPSPNDSSASDASLQNHSEWPAGTGSTGPNDPTSVAAPLSPPATSSAFNLTEPLGGAAAVAVDDSQALYFAFGPVDGGSTLLQVNWDGTVRKSLELEYSISGMAPDRDRLLATVGSFRVGRGRVVALDSHGSLMNVFCDSKLLPDTTGIWSTPDSDEMIVADNGADVVVALAKDGKASPRKLIEIEGHPDYQSMSVAKCSDGSLLYSGSDLKAVYRVPPGAGSKLHDPVLPGRGAVSADPNSTKWVATLADELHVFDGDRHVARFSYPEGRSRRYPILAFSNKGQLILGLEAGKQLWIYAVDLATGDFHGLFYLRADRVTAMAIAPKMNW